MKPTPDKLSISDMLDLRKQQMLVVNAEYQRGAVWTRVQQQKLVDSVLRGYPIPLIYFHLIIQSAGKLRSERFEIIDGQQRINALSDFCEGAFKLLDPVKEEAIARFPDFIKKQPCPWAGKRYQELDQSIRDGLLARELQIVKIETDDPNEARDLFVRLQAGMPLNSQEKRDAWPGQFTEFVLRLGGKVGLAKYPGHDFFNQLMQARRTKDRGKFRQLAAQIAMLYFTHREKGAFCDINSAAIDDFYYENLGFDADAPGSKRLYEVLDKITLLLGDRKRPKIIGHEAIHLVLFVDSLLDDYTRSWETQFAAAFDQFRRELSEARLTRYEANPYWLRYGVGTRVNSDRHDVIQRRHEFFAEKMRTALDLQMKDPQRAFGRLERELIYYRQRKQCAVCSAEVVWEEAEIHHVTEHNAGGKTALENGALVHHDCHPKGRAAAEFAAKWGRRGADDLSAGPSRDELAEATQDEDENGDS